MGLDKDLNPADRSSSEEPIETQPRLRRSKSIGSTVLKGVVPDVSTEELGGIKGHVEPTVPVDFQACQKRGVVSFTKSDQEQTNDREKKPKTTLPPRKPQTWRFACPFYKHAPEIHKSRKACQAYPGFESVHRVKEHIWRAHRLLPRCGRCLLAFGTKEELTIHSRIMEPCKVSDREPLPDSEYCSPEQEDKLRKRVLVQSEHDRWGDVYRILFPKQSEYGIPDPYYSEPVSRPVDILAYVAHLVDERLDARLKAASRQSGSVATSPPVIELIGFEADTYTAHVGNAAQSHKGVALVVGASQPQGHPVAAPQETSQITVPQIPSTSSPLSPLEYRRSYFDMEDHWSKSANAMSTHHRQSPRNLSGNNPFAQDVSLSPVQPVPKMQPDRIVSTEYAHASQHVPRRFPNPYAQTPMTAGSEIFGDHPTSRMSYTSSHTTNPTLESPTALTEQFSTVAPTQHAPVDFQPPFPPPCQLPAQLVAPMNIPSHELLSSQDIWNSTNPFRYNSTSQQVLRDTSIPNMDWDDFFAHVRQDTTGM